MSRPLQTTFEILSKTRNQAAVPVLIAALEDSGEAVFEGALKSLVKRRNKQGHLAVLGHWHRFTESQKNLVDEGRGRMGGALRDAVLSDDPQLFSNACELVIRFGEFDLVSTLVTLAENEKSPNAQAAAELVLALTRRLSELIHAPRDYSDRRDPQSIRRFVLGSLEQSTQRFRRHNRAELLEAFVVLGGATSGLLRTILDDPRHVCYQAIVQMLSQGHTSAMTEVLIDLLQSKTVPHTVLTLISRRKDEAFAARLMEVAASELSPSARKNLGRIESFGWLQPSVQAIQEMSEEDQARCVKLVALSGMKQDEVLNVIETVLKTGALEGRLAACEALAGLSGDRINTLILNTLSDDQPQVQVAIVRQLGDRQVAGTTAKLVTLLDSPYEAVQEAARGALSDFSFQNYLNRFEILSDRARASTGLLVSKVDRNVIASLNEEFQSDNRSTRLRAITIAECMRLLKPLSGTLLRLLEEDSDHLVRASVAEVLQQVHSAEVLRALQYASEDKSSAVKYAALSSLEILAGVAGLAQPADASVAEKKS